MNHQIFLILNVYARLMTGRIEDVYHHLQCNLSTPPAFSIYHAQTPEKPNMIREAIEDIQERIEFKAVESDEITWMTPIYSDLSLMRDHSKSTEALLKKESAYDELSIIQLIRSRIEDTMTFLKKQLKIVTISRIKHE